MNAPLTSAQQESAYLARLGERVRAWRTEHGMTRKALAQASGVSERYLAQLEAGEGNISVLLLRKVARAMGVPVEQLVREEERAPRAERIALLGLRGAGKSTLGEKLADSLGVPFIELDHEVEKEAGAKLGEVFAMYGQDAFRRFERRALERVLREAAARGHRRRRQPGHRPRHLRAAARALPLRLAEGLARGAHVARHRAGRHAPVQGTLGRARRDQEAARTTATRSTPAPTPPSTPRASP